MLEHMTVNIYCAWERGDNHNQDACTLIFIISSTLILAADWIISCLASNIPFHNVSLILILYWDPSNAFRNAHY